jgi:formylglycine-generating enzyme required for sulfatase activity
VTYRVFVSSTFEDLKEHRAHVIRALRKAGFSVDPMEDWTADSDEPKKFSQNRIEGCDLCVLLVAYRRGYVPDGEKLSITQLEYEAAVKQGIDILPFILKEDEPWKNKFYELEKDPEIRLWRAELTKLHGVEFFSYEPASIDMTGTLGRWLAKKVGATEGQPVTTRIEWPEGKSPYPGLMSFDQDYAPLFFGRDREIDAIIAKMSEPQGRFLIISGASGSGKSSLVAAGVWRALFKHGRIAGSRDWIWLRIQPGKGETPFKSLAWPLTQAFPKIPDRPDELAKTLVGDRNSLHELSNKYLDRDKELVLFVDQMEELFTRSFENKDVKEFLELMATAVRDKTCRLRVLATIRSEFLARLEESEAVLELLNAGYNHRVGPMSLKGLREMIEKPALSTGYTFEPPDLVDEILRDAGQELGHLPLVAYALNQLFNRRSRERQLLREAYDAMGRVAGAIGTEADRVIDGLKDQNAVAAFDRLFSQLVHIERDGTPTRRRASLSRFDSDADARKLIEALSAYDCRILVTDAGPHGRSVEVAHEKLFTAWSRLKDWIDRAGDDLRLIEHAAEEAQQWHRRGQRVQDLWEEDRAGEVVAALKRFARKAEAELDRFLRPQEVLIEKLDQITLSHEERALIGRTLAEFGDPREGVGLREDGLPDILWSNPMEPGKVEIEGHGVMAITKPFCIAMYPVTNMQFDAFLKTTDGYQKKDWWQHLPGTAQGEAVPSWRLANHPRETVSWYEAVAFCRWLTQKYREMGVLKSGQEVRLPTEWEWQLVATGGDPGSCFPWGRDWDPLRCNSDESRLNCTTAVGIYPRGATAQGVLDVAGNVWEWCLNKHENPNDPDAIGIDSSGDYRVMRGGSWGGRLERLRSPYRDNELQRAGLSSLGIPGYRAGLTSSGIPGYRPDDIGSWVSKSESFRSSYRFWSLPAYRAVDIGFRIVQDIG